MRAKPRPNPLNITPARHVLDRRGLIKPHPFEEPHDAPGQDTCWDCILPKEHKIHSAAARRAR